MVQKYRSDITHLQGFNYPGQFLLLRYVQSFCIHDDGSDKTKAMKHLRKVIYAQLQKRQPLSLQHALYLSRHDRLIRKIQDIRKNLRQPGTFGPCWRVLISVSI